MAKLTTAEKDERDKKRLEKRHAAMIARLEDLPDDNAVVEAALAEDTDDDRRDAKYEQWEIVSELVSSACSKFVEGKLSFKKAVGDLGLALTELAKK